MMSATQRDGPGEPAAGRTLHLHGPGRAATALGVILQRAGWRVTSLSGGSAAGAAEAASLLDDAPWTREPPVLDPGTLLVLGVPDDALRNEAARLAAGPLLGAGLAIHLSGSCPVSVLAPLGDAGLEIGALHPLRSFPSRDPGPGDLKGAAIAIEAPHAAVRARLLQVARDAGGAPFVLEPEARPLYHLAASMMSNGLVALADIAIAAMVASGAEPCAARAALGRLASGTLDNIVALGPSEALTGPVARGDIGVVEGHLDALRRWRPKLLSLYGDLVAVQVAMCADRPDGDRARAVLAWMMREYGLELPPGDLGTVDGDEP